MTCSAFEPVARSAPAIFREWYMNGGWDGWYPLFIEQWCNGVTPRTVTLIKAGKPPEGREFSDDRYYVPYSDFINCRIMQPDGIHYVDYAHIERSRSSPIGYIWKHEGPGILQYDT